MTWTIAPMRTVLRQAGLQPLDFAPKPDHLYETYALEGRQQIVCFQLAQDHTTIGQIWFAGTLTGSLMTLKATGLLSGIVFGLCFGEDQTAHTWFRRSWARFVQDRTKAVYCRGVVEVALQSAGPGIVVMSYRHGKEAVYGRRESDSAISRIGRFFGTTARPAKHTSTGRRGGAG